MKFLRLPLRAGLFLVSFSAGAIVNGEPITNSNHAPALRSVLALTIRYSPCSGTYLGHGRILTAAHCLLMDGYPEEKAPICVRDGLGNDLGCLGEDDYTVSFPRKERDGPKAPVRGGTPFAPKVVVIPIPDMAMITVGEAGRARELRESLEAIRPVTPLTRGHGGEKPLSEEWIAGQGCDNYLTFEGKEIMRVGRVILDPATDASLFFMKWIPRSGSGGVCPGDSGGALFKWSAQGSILQTGVISHIQRNFDQSGLISVSHAFGRIDGASASAWLEGR